MNKCCYCGEETKNKKYCSNLCCNRDRAMKSSEIQYGKKLKYKVLCNNCNKEIDVFEFERLHPKKEKYYCCRSCANSRIHSDETKSKISKSLTKDKLIKICEYCGKEFKIKSYKNTRFCGKICSNKITNLERDFSEMGKKSVLSQNRRSKNEIYFAELCEKDFKNIKKNEQIFNGWDADIILTEQKLAILWDGNWHHKKISKEHSLKQVQNRDKIKIKEIIDFGYEPYIINDFGKYNKQFVENEYKKLKEKYLK